MKQGFFITFEGGEGAGKSTQVRRLLARLSACDRSAMATREPGGSPGAEALRDLLVQGEADRWSSLSETLILYAARADHLERTIRPALERGQIVICDRFADSTRAYQGAGGGVDPALIAQLETAVLGPTRPDLTLILDLPVDLGLQRAGARGGGEMRFEAKGVVFHQKLRQGFLDLARAEPDRCTVIDAAQSEQAVEEAIWAAVNARLGSRS